MQETLDFSDLLRLIDDRATAFSATIASAPGFDIPVPTCPDWTLFDLIDHLGTGRRAWAATVAAGPDAKAKTQSPGPAAPKDREALLAWWAESANLLLAALREAGPDGGCWVGWGDSQAPPTAGAVARHQVQEIAIHTYDAQRALGTPQPLPEEVAVDGVEEFQFTCVATTSPWPHEPAIVDYYTTEGRSWRLWLDANGARTVRLTGPTADGLEPPTASSESTASDLILYFYKRIPQDTLKMAGSLEVIDQLVAWEPE